MQSDLYIVDLGEAAAPRLAPKSQAHRNMAVIDAEARKGLRRARFQYDRITVKSAPLTYMVEIAFDKREPPVGIMIPNNARIDLIAEHIEMEIDYMRYLYGKREDPPPWAAGAQEPDPGKRRDLWERIRS